jgi:hypothetical protein
VIDAQTLQTLEDALRTRGARRVGRHLRFCCPAHDDHQPSADYDLSRRVWTCRSCHAGGGALNLARLLGLASPQTVRPPPRPVQMSMPPRGLPSGLWVQVWLAIRQKAQQQQQRLDPYLPVWRISDWLRPRHQAVADARRLISRLGPDDERAWHLADLAARVATTSAAIESELDEVLPDVG